LFCCSVCQLQEKQELVINLFCKVLANSQYITPKLHEGELSTCNPIECGRGASAKDSFKMMKTAIFIYEGNRDILISRIKINPLP